MSTKEILLRHYKRKKLFYRILSIFYQIAYQPLKALYFVVITFLFSFLWQHKNIFTYHLSVPEILEQPLNYSLNILLAIFYILSIIKIYSLIAYSYSYKDEHALIGAFSAHDLKNGYPILIKRKTITRGVEKVTIQEFYSPIPKKTWEDKSQEIQDHLNVSFVEPIFYGGKNQNKGNRITIYSIPNRKLPDRGIAYDKQL